MSLITRLLTFVGIKPARTPAYDPEMVSNAAPRRNVAFIFHELYDQIIQEIESLDLDERSMEQLKQMIASRREVDASTVYRAEMFLIGKLDLDALRLRVLTLRELLSGLLTKEAYDNFEKGLIPDISACANPAVLRAEASALASRTYRRYALVPAVEYQRAAMVARMAAWLAVFAVALTITGYIGHIAVFYPLALICGAFGAAMSVTVRLYSIDPRHEPLLTWLSVEQGKRSIYLSPVLGAAFGLVFLLVVRANLVSGDMFPNFQADVWLGMRLSDHGCANLNDVAVNERSHKADCGATYLQYAKVAVWAFIAGWAERMVPDVLNKLSQQPQISNGKSGV